MRSILRGLGVVCLLVAAVAVMLKKPRARDEQPAGFTKIQYWEKWTGEEAEGMRRVVDRFNATVGREKKIFVEYVSMSQVDQKTLVATAAGVPPDVAGLWDGQLVQFAAMDALEPLDALAAEFGIQESQYKPVYWRGCTYRGNLWGLVSTPAAIALHYNKQAFIDRADAIRAAGLDPDRPPQTLQELDRYAEALTTYRTAGGAKRLESSGFLPLEPGWWIGQTAVWFGGDVYDAKTEQLAIDSPPVRQAFDWIASYSRQYGKDAITEFRSGLGGYASAQNPFFTGTVAMEQQGSWMAKTIETIAPRMNRWHMPAEALAREQNIGKLKIGMPRADVIQLLGAPSGENVWDAGIRQIKLTFGGDDRIASIDTPLLPAMERRQFCQWGAAPFPSAIAGDRTSLCSFDVLVIPRGGKHTREAFEFLAYVNRQDVMESLCADHCKNSPLKAVSEQFLTYHPNPYIEVFEELAGRPEARGVPHIPIWPEMADELSVASQKSYLLATTPEQAVHEAAARIEAKWMYFKKVQAARERSDGS